ncbi:hypothetical protein [Pseudonocardia sp.]|uniref:hypothetical protein n=1 Tax=Pseudonocardia sp. TaxID=60912 RepID=UPI0031FC2A90
MIDVLQIAGAHHRYGALTALDSVDLTRQRGRVRGAAGPERRRQDDAGGGWPPGC